MSRLLITALAAATALGLATPTMAQDSMGTMSSSDVPWCSKTITDQCRQHEGMSGTSMHQGMKTHDRMMHNRSRNHHRMMKHRSRNQHRNMHRTMKRHETMKM